MTTEVSFCLLMWTEGWLLEWKEHNGKRAQQSCPGPRHRWLCGNWIENWQAGVDRSLVPSVSRCREMQGCRLQAEPVSSVRDYKVWAYAPWMYHGRIIAHCAAARHHRRPFISHHPPPGALYWESWTKVHFKKRNTERFLLLQNIFWKMNVSREA